MNRQIKWPEKKDNLSVDDVMFEIDDKYVEKYKGKDEKVRVVKDKIKNGTYKRQLPKFVI